MGCGGSKDDQPGSLTSPTFLALLPGDELCISCQSALHVITTGGEPVRLLGKGRVDAPRGVNAYLRDSTYAEENLDASSSSRDLGSRLRDLRRIHAGLVRERPDEYPHCVRWAAARFREGTIKRACYDALRAAGEQGLTVRARGDDGGIPARTGAGVRLYTHTDRDVDAPRRTRD